MVFLKVVIPAMIVGAVFWLMSTISLTDCEYVIGSVCWSALGITAYVLALLNIREQCPWINKDKK